MPFLALRRIPYAYIYYTFLSQGLLHGSILTNPSDFTWKTTELFVHITRDTG